MLTKVLINPTASLIAALTLGLLSQTAAATEEVVVTGVDVSAQATAERLQSEIKDHVLTLNHRLKATLDEDLRRLQAPRPRIALSRIPTRG